MAEWPECSLKGDMPIQLSAEDDQRIRRGERLVVVKRVPQQMFDGRSELQCQRNHSQSLAEIKSRGGFDAHEVLAVFAGTPFGNFGKITADEAHRLLYAMIALHNRGQLIGGRALSPEVGNDK